MAQTQISTLLQPVRQACRECPITTMTDAYVRAARMFCNRSRWLRSTLIGATVAPVLGVGTSRYNLGSDTYNEIMGVAAVAITESTTDSHALTESESSTWDADEAFEVPDLYQYVPHGQIAVHPTPAAVYTLTISLVLQPKLGSNSVDSALLVNWDEALIDGTLARLHNLKGTPWYDQNEARMRMLLFNAEVNSARSDALAGYNAGALPTDAIGPRNASMRTKLLAI